MYDKIETRKVSSWKFPCSKYIEYEISDIEWAYIGYAKLDKVLIKKFKNEIPLNYRIEFIDDEPPNEHEEIIIKEEVISTSIVLNPNSTWKPEWNPELIG